MAIQEIKLKDIAPGENYRKHYDKQKMKELTASVKELGVLEPVIVRKAKKGYELVVGERRRRASIAAKKTTLPAIVRTLTDKQVIAIQLAENKQREDTNPVDEAGGFQRALDVGYTVESIAAEIGFSPSYVYTRLRLNSLPKKIQKALLEGDIDFGHALVIMRLGSEEDQERLFLLIINRDLTVRQAQWELQSVSPYIANALFDKESCAACPSLSQNQRKLFPEAEEKDRCMDPACFRAKNEPYLADQRARGKAEKKKQKAALAQRRKDAKNGEDVSRRGAEHAEKTDPSVASPCQGEVGGVGVSVCMSDCNIFSRTDCNARMMPGPGSVLSPQSSALDSASFDMIIVKIDSKDGAVFHDKERGIRLIPAAGCDPAVLDLQLGQKVKVTVTE